MLSKKNITRLLNPAKRHTDAIDRYLSEVEKSYVKENQSNENA